MKPEPARVAAGFGLGLIVLGAVLYWYDPVLFPGFTPFGLPMFHGAIMVPPRFYLGLSYGWGIVLGLGLAWVGWEMRRPVAIAWAALWLLLLGWNCPLQIAYSEPSWLDQFLQARNDNLAISSFGNATDYNVEILGLSIPSARLLNVEGLYDRWYAAVVAMQIGWWIYLAGALLFLGAALFFAPGRRLFLQRAAVVVLVFLAFHGLRPALGEMFWHLGQSEERAGQRDAAERSYRWALALDAWNRRVPRVYERLGALAEAGQRVHAPEYFFFLGRREMQRNELSDAMNDYFQAMTAGDPDLRRLAGRAYGQAAFAAATSLYQNGRTPGVIPVKLDMVPPQAALASCYWQKAAQASENDVADAFMAARAAQDAGQYDRATTLLDEAAAGASDPMILSNFDTSRGDVDYLRGDPAAARLDYLQAYKLLNHNKDYWSVRAVKDLTDNAVGR